MAARNNKASYKQNVTLQLYMGTTLSDKLMYPLLLHDVPVFYTRKDKLKIEQKKVFKI